jgi:hypothetical protein
MSQGYTESGQIRPGDISGEFNESRGSKKFNLPQIETPEGAAYVKRIMGPEGSLKKFGKVEPVSIAEEAPEAVNYTFDRPDLWPDSILQDVFAKRIKADYRNTGTVYTPDYGSMDEVSKIRIRRFIERLSREVDEESHGAEDVQKRA